jgi:putrescine aminotransferase
MNAPLADFHQLYAHHVSAPYVDFLTRFGLALEFTRAEGSLVYAADGRSFIDAVAGYGNLNLGHNHPSIRQAVRDELESSRPFGWPFISEKQARLAARLEQIAPPGLECSFLVNSGAEAVDSALKLVRLTSGKSHIVAARGAWHGFTFGALSVSEPLLCQGLSPLLPNVTHVPYGDAAAIDAALTDQTGCVMVEPIQAESGAVTPPPGYLRDLEQLCHQREVALIFDEVKTGMGKTGRMFACEHDAATPDILLTGKSLGGGAMPIGAVVARRNQWHRFGASFPMASSSAAGNSLACAAALATLDVIASEDLCHQADRKGQWLRAELENLAREFPERITGVSGRGLLLAIHTPNPKIAAALTIQAIQRGLLIMPAFCQRAKILVEPPLSIPDDLLKQALVILRESTIATR